MRFTIGTKLYTAFGIVLFILIMMVFVSIRSGNNAQQGMTDVAEMTADTDTAAGTIESMLMMRLSVKDFLLTNDNIAVVNFKDNSNSFREGLNQCKVAFQNPSRVELVNQIEANFKTYESTFTRVTDVIGQRNSLITNRLDVIGPHLVEITTKYRSNAVEANDVSKLAVISTIGDYLTNVRIAALKYIRTSSDEDLEHVLNSVTAAQESLAQLHKIDDTAVGQETIAAIDEDLKQYAQTFNQIDKLIKQRNDLVINTLDVAGAKIAEAGKKILDSLKEDSQTVSSRVNGQLASSRTQTLIAAAIAISISIVLAVVVSRGVTKPIKSFIASFEVIAAGDLTQRVACKARDEIGDLAKGFNTLIAEISSIICSVQDTANNVAAAATEVAATSEQMASTTDQQRSQVTQVAAAVEQLSATINEVSGRTSDVSRQSTGAGQQASEGGQIVSRTVSEMEQIASQVDVTSTAVGNLSTKADQIGEILTVINDIADQTNLLALNAAIEAARAGEHGRGFAVVADEVRKLAERTQQATQEVSQSITEIQHSTAEATEMMGTSRKRVASGVELAQQAGRSLESIVNGSNSVAQSIDSIAAAVEEQSATSTEIARSIEVISASADEASQGAGQAAAAATQLSGNAETLRELVARFKAA